MPRRLIITIICFRISEVLLVLLGVLAIAFANLLSSAFGDLSRGNPAKPDDEMFAQVIGSVGAGMLMWVIVFVVLCAVYIVGLEFVIRGLKNGRYWAWIVGLVVSGLFIVGGVQPPFLSLVLGGLALWGLVDPDSVAAFRPVPSYIAPAPGVQQEDSNPNLENEK